MPHLVVGGHICAFGINSETMSSTLISHISTNRPHFTLRMTWMLLRFNFI